MPFFSLESKLKKKCSVPLVRSRKRHRWGFGTRFMKRKSFRKIKTGEFRNWDALRWRLLISSFSNRYKPWYSITGKFLSSVAKEFFQKGAAVESYQEVLDKVREFNAQLTKPLRIL